MAEKKRIIAVENITELNKADLEKIKQICFKIAKRYKKIYYNTHEDFQLYLDTRWGNNKIYAKCMHWAEGSGTGINFVIECSGNIFNKDEPINILKKNNWSFCTCENANYPQNNSMVNTLTSPYNFYNIKLIKVGDESSELITRGK